MKKSLLALAAAIVAAPTMFAANLDSKNVAIFIDAQSVSGIANNQEKTAAEWLLANGNSASVVTVDDLTGLNPETTQALWIHVDRCGIGAGSANLPAPFNNAGFVADLKKYVKNGGSLLLTKHATQLATAMGRIDKEANCFSAGDGGEGFDTWTLQNVYGVAPDVEGPMDRSGHVIYEGLETIDDFGTPTVALLGTGSPETSMWREDHNCFWIPADLGFGSGNANSACIEEFEAAYNCQCLGTWGHVGDYCGAGVIDFAPNDEFKGRVLVIGLAAYEWAPRNGGNAYHSNIENLTSNALSYLAASNTSAVETLETESNAAPVYYNLQGVRVDNPVKGSIYIECRGAKAVKVVK